MLSLHSGREAMVQTEPTEDATDADKNSTKGGVTETLTLVNECLVKHAVSATVHHTFLDLRSLKAS